MPILKGASPFKAPFHALIGFALGAAGLASAQQSATVDLPDSIAAPNTQVVWTKKVPFFCEGPAMDQTDGNTFYFTEQHDNSDMNWPIWKLNLANPSDTGTRWVVASNQSNGLFVDGQGRVIAAQKGKITRYAKNGTVDSVLAASGNGATFGQANDFSVGKNGNIFFSDLGSQIFYVDGAHQVKVATTGLSGPNGVEWVEGDDNGLYVAAGGHLIRFDVGANGALSNKKDFYSAMTGADGMETDIHGNWYIGSYSEGAVHVCNAAGKNIGKITFKMAAGPYDARSGIAGNIVNCHFGGPDNTTLLCAGDGGVYSIKLKIPGRKSAAATPTGTLAGRNRIAPKAAKAQAYRPDGRFFWELADGNGPRAMPRLPLLNQP